MFGDNLNDDIDDQLADIQQTYGLQRHEQPENEAQDDHERPQSQTIFSTGGRLRIAERRSCQALVMDLCASVMNEHCSLLCR